MKGLAIIAIVTAACTPPLQRQEREATIYVLKGDQAALAEFAAYIDKSWTGGTLMGGDSKPGAARYWAYARRTASESRYFVIPAQTRGLMDRIEAYDAAKAFPAERRKLDAAATACGVRLDPFFVTPIGEVGVKFPQPANAQLRDCLWNAAKASARHVFIDEVIID